MLNVTLVSHFSSLISHFDPQMCIFPIQFSP